jgi:hypothetical protein
VGWASFEEVKDLADAAVVPLELIRMAPFKGKRLNRDKLLAATQRAIETLQTRNALSAVINDLKSIRSRNFPGAQL